MGDNYKMGEDVTLRYRIKTDFEFDEANSEYFDKIKEVLNSIGCSIYINSDNVLTIKLNNDRYEKVKKRNAGRRRRSVNKPNSDGTYKWDPYTYTDVILLLNNLKNADVAKMLGMPIATFARRKKVMVESVYYQGLDKNRLDDKEYLMSVDGYDQRF